MGTGSGIIGITLALELKDRAREVVLADISPKALDLALENAMRLGARVSTIQTDLFENLPATPADEERQSAAEPEQHTEEPWNSPGPCRKPALTSLWPTCPILRTARNLLRK